MAKGTPSLLQTKPSAGSHDLFNRREYPNYIPEHRRRSARSDKPSETLVKRAPMPMPIPKPSDSSPADVTFGEVRIIRR
ncbi:hypothetical protein H4R33_007139, partial [Dimargaris cristalligena]